MKILCKTLISVALALSLLLSCAAGAGALRAPCPIGDTDGDWDITILDATHLQRWLAGYGGMDKLNIFLGDVNGDKRTDILDAAVIRRKLVGLSEFYAAVYGSYFIEDYSLSADYDSGKARVGVPVTFSAMGEGVSWANQEDSFAGGLNSERADLPITYEFYINNELAQERSENSELTYTFSESGTYRISVIISNALDRQVQAYIYSYYVADSYPLDTPVIVSARFPGDTRNRHGYSPLTVRAEGGSGEYTYMFRVEGSYDGYEKDGFFMEELCDEWSVPVLSTGYIDSDTFTVPEGLIGGSGEFYTTIYINARDSRGNISPTVTREFKRYILLN